jgi:hypothetical protein
MGSRRGAYEADFPIGTIITIKPVADLERFRAEWTFHHKLQESQLADAGKTARVWRVGFYHGSDELYELDGVPGRWHECCLEAARARPQPLAG